MLGARPYSCVSAVFLTCFLSRRVVRRRVESVPALSPKRCFVKLLLFAEDSRKAQSCGGRLLVAAPED